MKEPHSVIPSIEWPNCPTCNTVMRAFGIEGTSEPDVELHSFECVKCGLIETRSVTLTSDEEVQHLAERMIGDSKSKL